MPTQSHLPTRDRVGRTSLGRSQYHGRQWNAKRHVRGTNYTITHFWRARQSAEALFRAKSYKSRVLSRLTGNVNTHETGNAKLIPQIRMLFQTVARIVSQ